MVTFAMFTLIGTKWRFEGFTYSISEVSKFIEEVEKDIKLTKDSPVSTIKWYIVKLEH